MHPAYASCSSRNVVATMHPSAVDRVHAQKSPCQTVRRRMLKVLKRLLSRLDDEGGGK